MSKNISWTLKIRLYNKESIPQHYNWHNKDLLTQEQMVMEISANPTL